MRWLTFVAIGFLAPSSLVAQGVEGYYRYPAIHGETIVFVAEGDLWKVGRAGGLAQRLTTHAEAETRPAISADGATLAFSASYEGPLEAYTMPMDGGLPTRLTYDGASARVAGWTPAGKLLYATSKFATLPNYQLVEIDAATRERSLIPLAQAADGSYDPASGTLYFTRLSEQGSRTKRYMGGTAQNLWKFERGAAEAAPLTPDYPGTSRNPMWWNGRVYFESDRDGTMNVWSMDPDGGDLRQHTHHSGWDVKTASLGDGRIAYQLAADIWVYDIAADETREIPITLISDFEQMREKWVDDPMDFLSTVEISSDGLRLAITARGEVFTAPVKQGRFIHVSRAPDVRYRQAMFMPDGESLLALSDESGEVEWWMLPANGIGERRQLTMDGKVLRFGGSVSPDGRWLAHYDQDQEIWLYDIERGDSKRLAVSQSRQGYDLSWSPDSRWLAFRLPALNSFDQVYVYDTESETQTAITTDRFNSYDPVWSADGEWIYFLSDRTFRSLVGSPWGARAPEPYFDKQTKIYAIALRDGVRFPFQPADELLMAESNADDDSDQDNDKEKETRVEIEMEGIQARIYEVPNQAGNYNGLGANGKRLFWMQRATGSFSWDLMALDIDNDEPEPKKIAEGVRGYELSGDGQKLMVWKGDAFDVIDASSGAGAKLSDAEVDLSNWSFSLDPREEWRQMFVESWRLERDYFYDPGMHGVDWDAMLEKYLPLVDRVTNRSELSDLQAQMVAELSALHIFVRGGDHREGKDQVLPASLGAVLSRDESAGGYRIEHIYRSDPDYPDELSPLARPGVDVSEGDVITAINGVSTVSVVDPAVLLRNQAGEQVRLSLRNGAGAHDVIVVPITQRRDWDLRYDEWEYTRRQMVDSISGGAIGYLHLRAMGGGNMAEFYRHFYPVYNRQGLIIDVRHNNGGNIDSWILEKLLRPAWFYWQSRVGDPTWNMQYAFRGHMVMLVDERTASDGEAVAEGFRRLDLGQLIGTRTWGGEIWLTSSNVLVDWGIATAAEFGVYGPEGEWLIEGHGVDPDIIVDNLPHATFNGEDAQLQAALEHLQELIRNDPRPVPPVPAFPDKSFRYPQRAADENGGG
jgi:tricorn protease